MWRPFNYISMLSIHQDPKRTSNVFIMDPNNERKSTMYLFFFLSGWTCKLQGNTWSHGSWMGETDPVSPPWPLPPNWAEPWTFQLQLEIQASPCLYFLRQSTNYMSLFNQYSRKQIQIDFKIQKPPQKYSKVFCLSVFLQKSLLWTSHQSPDEQKRPAVWQRQERMVCGAICFGGHPKSCVWAILSYPTIPFQECTSLLFTQWAIYCPSLGWHFFPCYN